MINSLRDKKADIEREISKVNNELTAALDHKDFIKELEKELSSSVKKGKSKKKNAKITDSDSEFFITTAQEKNDDEINREQSEAGSEASITKLQPKEELPMDKETLFELIFVILEEKNLALINQNQEADETLEDIKAKHNKIINKRSAEIAKNQK
mmetsp:Transcript_9153/g.10324  ORF Transcript_9153/g.10324 Transcript_9153/m.10324 type:complete len:155 (-) Transcript_9153:564-1028(-)